MNTETGQIKPWNELTEEEKKSGKWIELPGEWASLNPGWKPDLRPVSKSDQKREEYMRQVAEKKKSGQNV